jgi:hypothetical protein
MPSTDPTLVAQLIVLCRQRNWMVKAQTRLTNQIKAIIRGLEKYQPGGQLFIDTQSKCAEPELVDQFISVNLLEAVHDKPGGGDQLLSDFQAKNVPAAKVKISAAEREFLRAAKPIIKKLGHVPPGIDPLVLAQLPIKKHRAELETVIEALAAELPVWADFAKDVRGIGLLGLGLIVGAAGRSLDDYPNPAKLWKRLGLAPGQRRYKEASKALLAGYSPQRRALMHNIAESLLKQNDGVYRQVYLDRKAYLIERSPEWQQLKKPRLDEEDESGEKKGGGAMWKYHQEAMRYLVKRFIKDLWKAWRGQPAAETPNRFAAPRATGTE